MDDQETMEIYEKPYSHEIEMRDRISERLRIPLVIILSFAGAHAYLIKDVGLLISDVGFENMSFWYLPFGIIFIISIGVFMTSIVFFAKAFSDNRYKSIPSITKLKERREKISKRFKLMSLSEEWELQQLRKELVYWYKKYTSLNEEVNRERSEFSNKANKFLAFNAFLITLAFLIFTFLI